MLSRAELKILTKLLPKASAPRRDIPQELFDALAQVVVFPAAEMVVANSHGEILLTWRDDPFWRGWHFPGGIIRFKESLRERIDKTLKRELGVKVTSHRFLFPMEYSDSPRGHEISLVFLCQIRGKPMDGRFFKSMPKDIILSHRMLWKQARKHVKIT